MNTSIEMERVNASVIQNVEEAMIDIWTIRITTIIALEFVIEISNNTSQHPVIEDVETTLNVEEAM